MIRLLACCLLVASAVAGESWPPSLDGLGFAWPRVDRLVEFKAGDYTSYVTPRGRCWYGANGELETDGGHFVANEPSGQALLKRIAASGRFSFAAMVDIQGAQQPAAWIASTQADNAQPQFALALDGGRIGVDAVTAPAPQGPFHVLVALDAQRLRLWINGKPAGSGAGRDPRGWTLQHLTFGSDWAGAHAFRGRISHIAAGDLAIDDAAALAMAGAARAAHDRDRVVPTRITFTGTVTEVGGDDPEAAVNYVRQLWLVKYEPITVTAGTHAAKSITVYRFGRLDKQPVPGVADLTPGTQQTLTVIPWAQARGTQYEAPCRTVEQEDDVFIEVGR